ncbi:ATP-binding protein [Rubripirellula amarantea]|nr:ATP-binding protein [Rubripirellula amarantea]
MTRLFLRFYIGVLIILIAAWFIQAYVYSRSNEKENIKTIEEAFGGGARLARDELMSAPPHERARVLIDIQRRFDFPITIRKKGFVGLPPDGPQRLQAEKAVFWANVVIVDMPDTGQWMVFGPLPKFPGPSQPWVSIGLGTVLLLAALAIAILLRPVVIQLRSVERAASAISEGDFSARIESGRFRRSLPIAGAFNSMADRMQNLLQSQRDLLQSVSHELRTPLARIRFATELLGEAESGDDRKRRLNAIDDATKQLDELVEELLTFIRLDSTTNSKGANEYGMDDRHAIELSDLLDEWVEVNRSLYPDICFENQVEQSVGVMGNRRLLIRALGNVLHNAGRHAKQCVTVTAEITPPYDAANETLSNQVRIFVDDDGAGVAEADRIRVFEPFVRLENARGQGTGLGLALVKRIVRRFNGDIVVTDSPKGGARLVVNLPAGTIDDGPGTID